ncbi:MAG: hypothetical protein IPP73_07755 [Chitinophagaceae bacterium]|nr:hypothetical protein [Chitinophagaceae bacterium]
MLQNRYRCLLLCISLVVAGFQAGAQDTLQGNCPDISQVRLFSYITKSVYTTYRSPGSDFKTDFPGFVFQTGFRHKSTIPNNYVSKKLVEKFTLCNQSEKPDSVYYFPGFYYKNIVLYRLGADNQPELMTRVVPPIDDSVGFRLIVLAPHDTITFLADLTFAKTYNNTIRPRLVKPVYLNGFIAELHQNHYNNDLVSYVLCGLLLMMVLFSFANYVQGANKEFLYYSFYALLLGVMLFTQAFYSFHTTRVAFYMEAYLDFIMQGMGLIFYMLFMQRFLETKTQHPFVYHLYNTGIIMISVWLILYSFFPFLTDNFMAENSVENITKFLLLIMILIFIIYSGRRWDDRLLRYVFWGNLCLFIFSVISQLAVLYYSTVKSLPGVFSSSIFYYELGLLLELVFFLAGLNHKNRRRLIAQTRERETLKAQNLLKEYEKELAVYKAQQAERERISADMHDELGSGMTAIRLMSEIARNKMKENTPVEIEKISSSADDVLNKMNAIIWSMNSGNDTLDNLISYIRSYSLEYFENTPITCKIFVPDTIPDRELAGDKRRNIFLCIKETLNNALKHSKGTEISIQITIDQNLVIVIRDNGKGVDMQQLRKFGNGLKNIGRRMENIGGTFAIESNGGTITTLTLPL